MGQDSFDHLRLSDQRNQAPPAPAAGATEDLDPKYPTKKFCPWVIALGLAARRPVVGGGEDQLGGEGRRGVFLPRGFGDDPLSTPGGGRKIAVVGQQVEALNTFKICNIGIAF